MINQSPHKSGKQKIMTHAPVASGLSSRQNAIKYLHNGIMSWNKHIANIVSYAQWK